MNGLEKHKNLIEKYKGMLPDKKETKKLESDPEIEQGLSDLDQIRNRYSELRAIIAFDTTGSMESCIESVRNNIGEITNELLEKENNIHILLAGVGEYCDAPYTLQMKDFRKDAQQLRDDMRSIKNTSGGGPCQVSLELLFQELNNRYIQEENKYALVVFTDQIAHGQDHQEPSPRADYKKELVKLKKSLAGFYIISCTDDGYVINLQKQLLNPESENERHILLEDVLKDKDLIPNLLIALIERTISIDKGNQYLNRLLGGTKKQREIAETIIKRGYLPPPKQ